MDERLKSKNGENYQNIILQNINEVLDRIQSLTEFSRNDYSKENRLSDQAFKMAIDIQSASSACNTLKEMYTKSIDETNKIINKLYKIIKKMKNKEETLLRLASKYFASSFFSCDSLILYLQKLQHSDLNDLVQQMKQKTEKQENEINELKQFKLEAENDLSFASSELKQILKDKVNIKSLIQLTKATHQKNAKLINENAKAKSLLQQISNTLNIKSFGDINKEIQTLKQNNETEINKLKQKVNEYESFINKIGEKLTKNANNTKEFINQIQLIVESEQKLKNENDKLKNNILQLHNKINSQNTKIQKTEKKQSENNELKNQILKLQNKLNSSNLQNANLQQQIEQIQNENDKLKNNILQLHNKINSQNTKIQQIERSKSEINELKNNIFKLQNKIKTMNSQKTNLLQQIEQSQSENNELKHQILKLQNKINKTNSQNTNLQQQIEQKRKEINELKNCTLQLQNEINSQNVNLQQQIKNKQNEINELKEIIKYCRIFAQKIGNILHLNNDEGEEILQQIKQKQNEIDELIIKNKEFQNEILEIKFSTQKQIENSLLRNRFSNLLQNFLNIKQIINNFDIFNHLNTKIQNIKSKIENEIDDNLLVNKLENVEIKVFSIQQNINKEYLSLKKQIETERTHFTQKIREEKHKNIEEYESLIEQLKKRCESQKETIRKLTSNRYVNKLM